LTQYAHGGGCACKIPPGELEQIVSGLVGARPTGAVGDLVVGLDHGDDAAVVRLDGGLALIATTDFFTPVVDDPYDWGRIAATNALSDVYAMGGRPVVAVNLLSWPRETLPFELATETLRGGLDVASAAGCHVAGGHSVDDPEPKYGMAVTGIGDPDRLLRNDAGRPGVPLTLTKPLGIGVLNSRHKATGEVFANAIDSMTTLNRAASEAALAAGITCATDITGFGLLGHAYKLARASDVTAVIDAAAVPYLDGAREALRDGYVSGGTRRNLDWVRPHADLSAIDEDEALLLADAQTSGGLLLAGEIPGAPVVGSWSPTPATTSSCGRKGDSGCRAAVAGVPITGSDGGLRAPSLVVALPDDLRVRRRADDRAHRELLVRLHRRLARAAVRLTPHDGDLGADRDVRVHRGQRQHGALVRAVPGEQRQSDQVAVRVQDRVEVGRPVVRVRQVEELVAGAFVVGQRAQQRRHVVRVPGERHLAALGLRIDGLQRFLADEVVVELHERAVAQFHGFR